MLQESVVLFRLLRIRLLFHNPYNNLPICCLNIVEDWVDDYFFISFYGALCVPFLSCDFRCGKGATIKHDEKTGAIIIARIMHGGAADRSGLIHVGDEVQEVNGIDVVGKTPADVLKILVCALFVWCPRWLKSLSFSCVIHQFVSVRVRFAMFLRRKRWVNLLDGDGLGRETRKIIPGSISWTSVQKNLNKSGVNQPPPNWPLDFCDHILTCHSLLEVHTLVMRVNSAIRLRISSLKI